MRPRDLALAAASLLAACSAGDPDGRGPGGGKVDDPYAADAGPTPDAGPPPDRIQIAATSKDGVGLPFSLGLADAATATTTPQGRIKDLDLASPGGSATILGQPAKLFAWWKTPGGPEGYNVYTTFAVGKGAVAQLWLYCYQGEGAFHGKLPYIASNGPGLPMAVERANDVACTESDLPRAGSVGFPAVDMAFPGGLIDSVTIEGDAIRYAPGAPGTLTLDDQAIAFFPWGRYDLEGGVELDVLFWNPGAGAMSFGRIGFAEGKVELRTWLELPGFRREQPGDPMRELPATTTAEPVPAPE
jgi:hypothetical protein